MSPAVSSDAEPVPAKASVLARAVAKISAALAVLAIVAYQTWFMPFFQPFFAGREGLARVVFYALYGSILAASASVLATRPDIRRKILPFAVAAALALAATALHPVGLATRAYIIALGLGGAAVVLTLASAPVAVVRLSASVSALNAVICLLDLLFADGFSNTAGRAAGLAINPNDAAAALLLGAAATYRAVPDRLRLSFITLVAGGIAATLSRSTILVAVIVVVITTTAVLWRDRRSGRRWTGIRPSLVTAVAGLLVVAIGAAFVTNDRLHVALEGSIADLSSAGTALNLAQRAVAGSVDAGAHQDASPSAVLAPQPLVANAPGVQQPEAATRIAALDRRLEGEGQRNTISARTLFLERALLTYGNNGFFGIGLDAAQVLAPHNTFVLFALAFGHLGWLIPLAVVGLAFYPIRSARDMPLGLAAIGTMLTSHDILLMPSLFLPIAIGVAGMLGSAEGAPAAVRVYRSAGYAVVGGTGLFLAGCIAILFLAPPVVVEHLRMEAIHPFRGVYSVSLDPPEFPGVFRLASAAGTAAAGDSFMHEGSAALARVNWSSSRPPLAGGQYAFQTNDTLLFAPSDASDPRHNGRNYEAGLPLAVSPLFYLLFATVILWCAASARALFRYADPKRKS